MNSVGTTLKGNDYPGRGICVGLTADAKKAVFAYFIMGRSENSRNRIFVKTADGIVIYPFDSTKVADPSLIIYSPVRQAGGCYIVTNGDQTDTVAQFVEEGKTFEQALVTRRFEPDKPNFTPRISAILDFTPVYGYKLSILKCLDKHGDKCGRFVYSYEPQAGVGHLIHTYSGNGNPIPSFEGEPRAVCIPYDIDEFCDDIWNGLDADNKVSLYVVYKDIATAKEEFRIVNKNKRS